MAIWPVCSAGRLAIAYSSVLIVVMVIAIAFVQLLVGERRLGRREAGAGMQGGLR